MSRVERLRELLAPQQLGALFISKEESRTYLTGFTGSAGAVLVTASEVLLLVDFRYVEQAAAEAPGCEVVRVPRQAADAVRSRLDWKYALSLAVLDPGFDHTVLSEFRTRLVKALNVPDIVIALLEDAIAIGGGFFLVSRF